MNVAECNKNHSNVIKMPEKKYNIPYEYFDAVARIRIPGEQMQILSFIVRKTWCWGKDEDMLSVSQFVEATGLSRQHVYRAIKALIGKKIIIGTKDGSKSMQIFEINKDFSSWAVEPKKVHEPKLVLCGTKNGYKQEPKMEHTKEYNKAFKENSSCPESEIQDEQSFFEKEPVQEKRLENQKPNPELPKPLKARKYIYRPEHLELSELLESEILRNKPNAVLGGNHLEAWADVARLMTDRDSRTVSEIREVLVWSQKDAFWKSNILSMDKLRSKFDQLQIRMTMPVNSGYSRPPVNEPSGRLPEWKGYDD